MLLAVIRHAESVENADKYNGFYQARRPYDGRAAHAISKHIVGLTARGFKQALWLRDQTSDLMMPEVAVYTSTYRRAKDTAAVAFGEHPHVVLQESELLDEQHYGEATYMSKQELYATYPEDADTRRYSKHLWVPPGGGESLAGGVSRRATAFLQMITPLVAVGRPVLAVTHHTMTLALRAELERLALTEVVAQARQDKPPNAFIRRYTWSDRSFTLASVTCPPC